mgnify:CR=1 FL=1
MSDCVVVAVAELFVVVGWGKDKGTEWSGQGRSRVGRDPQFKVEVRLSSLSVHQFIVSEG